MIENGSDIHQGGDGPLMRAALQDDRIPMMELLVRHGANVNALWDGHYPIICAPCETLAARALKWLLQHGADPNTTGTDISCVPMLVSTYWRDPVGKSGCLEIFADAGFPFPDTAPMAIHRGRVDLLEACLTREPAILQQRWPESDFFPLDIKPGSGLHGVPLDGTTLLHMAIEYQEMDVALWLIDQGADVNARAIIGVDGFGGHTPLFHTIVTPALKTDELARLLLRNGADPNARATFRKLRGASGDVEKGQLPEYHNASVLDFAKQFEDLSYINETAITVIREHGGK
jgi:ankyrin repeat protein